MSRNLLEKMKFPEIDFFSLKDTDPEVPDLTGVHIWEINLSLVKHNPGFFDTVLSPDEYEKSMKFRFADDRVRSSVSRGCLRILCSKYLSVSPEDLIFSCTSKGRPYLLSADFSFNVSHSKDFVLIGFSKLSGFGVDIEYNRRINDYMSIAEKYFHGEEYGFLKSLDKDEAKKIFLKYWTAKESYVKALGDGIGKRLNSFYIKEPFPENQFAPIHETQNNSCSKICVYSYVPHQDYFAAFCLIMD